MNTDKINNISSCKSSPSRFYFKVGLGVTQSIYKHCDTENFKEKDLKIIIILITIQPQPKTTALRVNVCLWLPMATPLCQWENTRAQTTEAVYNLSTHRIQRMSTQVCRAAAMTKELSL